MKRRNFFAAIGAALGAAKVAPAALKVEEIAVGGESSAAAPIKATEVGLKVVPYYTRDQQSVIDAMDPKHPAIAVLFSGYRACGKTFICRDVQWGKGNTLIATQNAWDAENFRATALSRTTVVRVGDIGWKDRLRGLAFQRVIVDDADLIEPDDLNHLIRMFTGRMGADKILMTGLPFGPSGHILRGLFLVEGAESLGRYHIHATIQPLLLAGYDHASQSIPADMRERFLNGDWA